MFKDKVLLITGGTGSFGNAVLERFLDTDIKEIRIFSRDEKKQDDMRKHYKNDKIKFYICLSTDKAAYPVNAMGTSKAMMEKVFVAKARTVSTDKTLICGTRYGNVMCSRGSVIPLFIEQIKNGQPLTVTEPNMTRYIMSLEEAVELVIFAFKNAETGDIMVQKAPACTVAVLAQAVKELFDADNEIKVIGIRHGEKMYETLLTNEECAHAIDMGDFYRVPADKRDLNYDKYFVDGNEERSKLEEYNSNNTELLNVEEVKEKLLTLRYIREELEAWRNR
ncbi:MAG: polysaccharide biosynthesis protein [Clostridium sp.]|uniref:polysaccharide biosynthesis protein n=1 Tax=Clostridium sp. TaxID=1506 RepID=UPI0029038575|nr:polysaccharide biosynthesis protein [Clostridium sp.]MDU3149226.1 polysaccharide biosynthesis protein [Clostridium sp.]